MTISTHSNLPIISVNYILRDVTNPAIGAWVTNQETKQSTFCDAVTIGELKSFFYDGYFTVNVTDILDGIDENSTFSVSVVDSEQLPIYRDIIVFSTRLDTDADYEQNNTDDEYTFA